MSDSKRSSNPFAARVRTLDRELASAEKVGGAKRGSTASERNKGLIAKKAKAALLGLRDKMKSGTGRGADRGAGGGRASNAPPAKDPSGGASFFGMASAAVQTPTQLVYANAVEGLKPTYYRRGALRGRALVNSIVFLFIVLFILFFYTKR